MSYYERNLPHWHPDARSIFLTWRLYGSLPQSSVKALRALGSTPGKQFLSADKQLDRAASGPRWLSNPEIAAAVQSALLHGVTLGHYELHAWVIMPNHVHVLLDPRVPLPRITNGIKGVSARDANRIQGNVGRHFWQDESFDHWIRNSAQFDRVRLYIENNPVKAGLASSPSAFRFSSAHARSAPGSTATPGCANLNPAQAASVRPGCANLNRAGTVSVDRCAASQTSTGFLPKSRTARSGCATR